MIKLKLNLYYCLRIILFVCTICITFFVFGNDSVMFPKKLDFLFRLNAPSLLVNNKNLQYFFNNNKNGAYLKYALLPDTFSAHSIKSIYIFGTNDKQYNVGALVILDSEAENKFWEFYRKKLGNDSTKNFTLSEAGSYRVTVCHDSKLGENIRIDSSTFVEPIIICHNFNNSLLIGTKSWINYVFDSPKISIGQANNFLLQQSAQELVSGKIFNRNISRHRNGKLKDDWLEITLFVKSMSINDDISIDLTIFCNSERYPVIVRSKVLFFYQFALMPLADSNRDLCLFLQRALKSKVKQRSLCLSLCLKRYVIKQLFEFCQTMCMDELINTVQLLGSM